MSRPVWVVGGFKAHQLQVTPPTKRQSLCRTSLGAHDQTLQSLSPWCVFCDVSTGCVQCLRFCQVDTFKYAYFTWRTMFIWIPYQTSVRTSQKTQTNLLVIFREIIGIYFKGHTKHKQRMTMTMLMNRDCTGFSTTYFILFYLTYYITFYNFNSKYWILTIKSGNIIYILISTSFIIPFSV